MYTQNPNAWPESVYKKKEETTAHPADWQPGADGDREAVVVSEHLARERGGGLGQDPSYEAGFASDRVEPGAHLGQLVAERAMNPPYLPTPAQLALDRSMNPQLFS